MRKFFYLFITLWVIGCTEDITILTDNQEPKLIVFGYITTDTTVHFIQLSQSIPYFGSYDPTQTVVSDAEVYINDIPLTEYRRFKGLFHTDSSFHGEEGKTYTLKVILDFNADGVAETYTAQTTVPRISKLDSVTFSYGALFEPNPQKDRPSITPAVNFKPYQNTLYGADFYYDTLKYSNRISNYELGILGTSAINQPYITYPLLGYRIRGHLIINNKDTIYTKPLTPVTFTLNNMTTELYTFYNSAQIEMVPSIPLFGGQPANVEGNISNGAAGCFGSYAISKITKKLPFTFNTIKASWFVIDTTKVTNPYITKDTTTIIVIKNNKGLIPKGKKDSIVYLKNFVFRDDVPKFAADVLQPDQTYIRDTFMMEHYSKIVGKNGTVWIYKSR